MKSSKSFFIFLIILSIGFGIAGYWYYQKNIYSKEVLKLEILGPAEIGILEETGYLVKYKNNGNVRLEEAKLIFEYPKHSLLEEGRSEREEINLPDIYPGEEKTLSFKARLLGKEGEARLAKAWLSYRPKNLEARYESATTFTTLIKQVPLTFEFDLPSKIESEKKLRFRLNYFSNIDYPISNLRIKIDYPSNFEFINSNPPSLEKTEWEIPLLNKAEGGRIEVLGKIKGEVGEQKIFKAEIGTWQDGEFVLLKEAVRGVEIVKPSLYITQEINGNPEYIADSGDLLHYQIFFKNIGDKALTNLFLVSELEGKMFDLETIKSEQGEFQTGDNSIIFDWRRVPKLRFLDSQEEGEVEFWINLKEDWQMEGPQDKNPIIKNKVSLSQVKEEFINKINSKLEISQKGYYQDEVFGNSGPMPPEPGKTTTFTIIWQVKNYYNDINNLKVKAVLPSNVRLTGKIFPEEESSKFAFDSQSREIVWDIGELEAGAGVLRAGPNLAFQVALTPGREQGGQVLAIIEETKIVGEDDFTEVILENTGPAIDTASISEI